MKVYTVHLPETARPGDVAGLDRAIFVRDGFHWLAAVVPLLWLLANRVWLGFLAVLAATAAIGALAATLNGLEVLVFSGGIGEKSAEIRKRICSGLGFLGIDIDSALNQSAAAVISSSTSRVSVRVIPTDEEAVIATAVAATLQHKDKLS
jgi:hypothetical protein